MYDVLRQARLSARAGCRNRGVPRDACKSPMFPAKLVMPQERPGFVVLQETAPGCWQVVGVAARRRGLTARMARIHAAQDATGGRFDDRGRHAAGLRSEWRIAAQF